MKRQKSRKKGQAKVCDVTCPPGLNEALLAPSRSRQDRRISFKGGLRQWQSHITPEPTVSSTLDYSLESN